MTGAPGATHRGWLAACAALIDAALICGLILATAGQAHAAPKPKQKIDQAPPGGLCKVMVCDPSKGKDTGGGSGKNPGAKQPGSRVAKTVHPKPKVGKDANYLEQLTGESRCEQGPHITAPYKTKRAGQAAGDCLPVKSFSAFYQTTSPTAGLGWQCFVPFFQGSCQTGSGIATKQGATDQALGVQFGFVWALYQAVVYLTAWFTQWGVGFAPLALVAGLAEKLQHAWQHQVIGPLHLGGAGGFFLLLAAFWAGLLMLFRRFRRGFAELMVAVLIAAIGAVFLAHPGTTISKLMNGARYFGLTVAVISLDPGGSPTVPTTPRSADKAATTEVGQAVSNKLVTSLLLKPHMIANTGKVQHGKCERWYWEALDPDYAHHNASYKALTNPKNGCTTAAALRPTVERIVLASLLLIMAIVVAAFCVLAVGLLLLSQLAAAAYLAVAGVVWAIAPLAGWGRGLLVKWLTGLLVCVAGTVAGILAIVVYLDVLGVILGLGESPLVSFTLALVVAIAGLALRKRLSATLRRGAKQIGARLESGLSRPGETLQEQAQRRQAGVSSTPVADAVAVGAGTGAVAGAFTKMSGTTKHAASELLRKPADDKPQTDGAQDAAAQDAAKRVGFGQRVRQAVGQSRSGKLALDTAAGAGGGGAANASAALGAPGVVALGATHSARAAKQAASKTKRKVLTTTSSAAGLGPADGDGSEPSGGGGIPPPYGSDSGGATGQKAARTAGRVASREPAVLTGGNKNRPTNGAMTRTGGPSSDRWREVQAELERRRKAEEELLTTTRPN